MSTDPKDVVVLTSISIAELAKNEVIFDYATSVVSFAIAVLVFTYKTIEFFQNRKKRKFEIELSKLRIDEIKEKNNQENNKL